MTHFAHIGFKGQAFYSKGQSLKRLGLGREGLTFKEKKKKILFIGITITFLLLCSLAIFASLYATYISYQDFIYLEPVKSLLVVRPSDLSRVLTESYECGGSVFCAVPSVSLIMLLVFIEAYNAVLYSFFRKKGSFFVLFGSMILLHSLLSLPVLGSSLIPSVVLQKVVSETNQDMIKKIQSVSENPGFLSDEKKILKTIETYTGNDIHIIEDDPLLALFLRLYAVDPGKIQGTFFQLVVVPSLVSSHKDEGVKSISSPILLDTEKKYLFIFSLPPAPVGWSASWRITPLLSLVVSKVVRGEYASFIRKKNEPEITILPDLQYVAVQRKRLQEILFEYSSHIQKLEQDLHGIEQDLLKMNTLKKQLSEERGSYKMSSDLWYKECIQELGDTHDTCQSGKKTTDESLRAYEKDRETIEKNISVLTALRPQYRDAIREEKTTVENIRRDPVVPELQDGIYYSPGSIYIRLHEDGQLFSPYLSTVLHEYLHYSSDNLGKSLPPFLEEGMTEFLNQKLLSSVFIRVLTDTSLEKEESYAEEVGIIKLLEEKIKLGEVERMYFNKNVNQISEILGKESFERFLSLGDRLYYLPYGNVSQREQVYKELQSLFTLRVD